MVQRVSEFSAQLPAVGWRRFTVVRNPDNCPVVKSRSATNPWHSSSARRPGFNLRIRTKRISLLRETPGSVAAAYNPPKLYPNRTSANSSFGLNSVWSVGRQRRIQTSSRIAKLRSGMPPPVMFRESHIDVLRNHRPIIAHSRSQPTLPQCQSGLA